MPEIGKLFRGNEGKFLHLWRPLVAPGGACGVGKPISICRWFMGEEVFDTTEAAIC